MLHVLKGEIATRRVWLDGKLLDPKKSQKLCNHSPDGFNWGYLGSGPAQLALAVLLELETDRRTKDPLPLYQSFKESLIARLPLDEDFEVEFSWPTLIKWREQ